MAGHPIPIGERGLRYLTDTDPDDVALQDFVSSGTLHAMDLNTALDWYARFHPKLTDARRAYLGCNDRFYLMAVLLHRRDVIHPWLYARVREVEKEPDGYLDLWARYHFKSSVITQAGTIQEILIDPNLTVAIFSVTIDIAGKFLRQIKETLESNALLKRIYADVLWQNPKKNAPLWSSTHGITVRRTANTKEPSVSAYGLINAMPTGSHFGLLVYDDLVDLRTVTNEDIIRKATTAWEMSQNLGKETGTRMWMIGTRYSFADTYGVIMERDVVVPRLYPATDDGTLSGHPIFLTEEAWERTKSAQRGTVAAQMLQNPLMGSENTFDVAWFRPYWIRPTILNVYILCDPAHQPSKKADRTGIAVIGIDAQSNKYLLDGARHRMKLSERYELIKTLYRKWKSAPGVAFVDVGYERYGMQSDVEVMLDWMKRDKNYFPLTELNWPREGGHSKRNRVERLEPDFRLSRFFLPGVIYNANRGGQCLWKVERSTVTYTPLADGERTINSPIRIMAAAEQQQMGFRVVKPIMRKDEDGHVYDVTKALMDEMLLFPFAPKDDLVDATSRIYDIGAVAPRRSSTVEEKVYADA